MKKHSKFLKRTALVCSAAVLGLGLQLAQAADTIKVGILHSLSGTMAISETTLKDTMLMLIDEQNKKGGLLGKKLEPVVVGGNSTLSDSEIDQIILYLRYRAE